MGGEAEHDRAVAVRRLERQAHAAIVHVAGHDGVGHVDLPVEALRIPPPTAASLNASSRVLAMLRVIVLNEMLVMPVFWIPPPPGSGILLAMTVLFRIWSCPLLRMPPP